jgi:Skp family chaperone for outer membrane proteins
VKLGVNNKFAQFRIQKQGIMKTSERTQRKAQKMAEQLSDAARKARNEYNRQWRKAHPDKVREYRRNSWERRAAREAAESSEVAHAN